LDFGRDPDAKGSKEADYGETRCVTHKSHRLAAAFGTPAAVASGGVAKEKTPGGYFEILVFLDAERCRNRSLPKLRKSDRIKFRWLKNPR
jgi:hypothetical protein